MYYPILRTALDQYSKYLESTYKSNVQVRTGQLRDSIKVWCSVDDNSYQLHLSLRNYWKFIPEVFPWNSALVSAGLPEQPIQLSSRAWWDTGSRYPIDFNHWQNFLNSAFEQDIQNHLNGLY